MVSFVHQVSLLYFIFVGLIWFCLCVYMYIFSHTFYCCKPLPLHWAFAGLWSFPFFTFFLSFSFFFLIFIILIFLNLLYVFYIYSFTFPTVLFPLAVKSLMFMNHLHLSLFNFAFLFLSFLSSLSSQHICSFCFHCFIPHLAPCSSFAFQFVL